MDTQAENITLFGNATVSLFNTTQGEAVAPLNWLFLLVTPIIVLVAAGNVLVIMAVCIDRKLRSSTNYFLTSLAVADLLVALTVMPPGLAMIINNYVWPFSDDMCGIWVMLDVFFSTASILHLCMISLDRYLALTRPFHYGPRRAGAAGGSRMGGLRYGVEKNTNFNRRVATRILVVWTIALGISISLPILGKQDRNNLFIDGLCAINMPEFATFGSLVAFFLPLVIMFAMYTLTIRMLRRQARLVSSMMVSHSRVSSRNYAGKRHRTSRRSRQSGADEAALNGGDANECATLMQPAKHFQGSLATDDETSVTDSMRSVLTRGSSQRSWDRCERCGRHIGAQKSLGGQHWARRTWRPIAKALRQVQSFAGIGGMVATADSSSDEICRRIHLKRCNCKPSERNNNEGRDRKGNFFPRKFPSYGRRLSSSFKNRAMASINNEQRASKVLGLIFVLFCLFWCPFFITNVVSRFCPSCDQELMGECMNWFVWVGYVSSGVNPCVYTMFSKRFRDTFRKLVTCRVSEINKRPIGRRRSSRHDIPSNNTSFVTFGGSSKRRASRQMSSGKPVRSPPPVGVVPVIEANQDSTESETPAEDRMARRSVLYKGQSLKAARASANRGWRSTWHAACVGGGAKGQGDGGENAKARAQSKRHFSASDVDRRMIGCRVFSSIKEADQETAFSREHPAPWLARPENFTPTAASSSDGDDGDSESVWASAEDESSASEAWPSVYDNVDVPNPNQTAQTPSEEPQATDVNGKCADTAVETRDFSDQACLIKRREALTREDSGMGASFEGCASLS